MGERYIYGLIDPESQASMTIGEMVTNMMGVFGVADNIKCSEIGCGL